MKIVIIGASGFLGTKLSNILSNLHEVIMADYINKQGVLFLDASIPEQVNSFLSHHKPDVVIDTVALTSSVECEKKPELARKLIYSTAKNIAESAGLLGIKMVFISSNYIFDGLKGNYSETNEVNPQNEYAKNKILAEKAVLKLKDSIVLRPGLMCGFNSEKNNNGVFDRILSNKEIELRFPNQIRQPILVEDMVYIIQKLIEKNQNGIFHVASNDQVTMHQLLKDLENIIRKESKIKITQNKDSLVKSPINVSMNISKIQNLGIKTHTLKQALEIIKNQVNQSISKNGPIFN